MTTGAGVRPGAEGNCVPEAQLEAREALRHTNRPRGGAHLKRSIFLHSKSGMMSPSSAMLLFVRTTSSRLGRFSLKPSPMRLS